MSPQGRTPDAAQSAPHSVGPLVLQMRDVHVQLGGRPVLRGVNCQFETGWTAIVGPNGAGKTTLLRTLAGLLLPCMLDALVKSLQRPGLDDPPERSRRLIGLLVADDIVFGLTMLPTYAIGCWTAAAMRGPRRNADCFRLGHRRPPHDD